MTTTVGFLYPGHSAEDDFPRMESLLNAAGDDVLLPLVHTDIGTDAHRVDALLEMGSVDRLTARVDALTGAGAEAAAAGPFPAIGAVPGLGDLPPIAADCGCTVVPVG